MSASDPSPTSPSICPKGRYRNLRPYGAGNQTTRAFCFGGRRGRSMAALARAQQCTLPVIGFMSSRSPEDSQSVLAAFRKGLSEGGLTEGKNVVTEFLWARGDFGRLPAFAAELVSRRVAVIVAAGGDVSGLAAKAATSTIPIVFGSGD